MTDTAAQTINLNQLDKTDWQSFRFDQIAKSISERIDPNNTDIEVYIGLEHLDSESLHIKRMGTPADVNGQKLKCYPGDVIFGKRRAYQRKAAIATKEAICSAHAMVLRANPEVIDQRLFPFFLHSDQFMHRAIDISVGSLSPTINWKTLREQEFLLPPKVKQAEMAELLWAMDEVIQKDEVSISSIKRSKACLQKHLFTNPDFPKNRLFEYCSVLGGYAFSSKSFISDGIPVIKIKNIVNGGIKIDSSSNCVGNDFSGKNLAKYKLSPGDILIAMTGATLGKVGVVNDDMTESYLNQRVGKFAPKDGVDSNFLLGIFDSSYFVRELGKYIGEGAQGNISSEDIEKTLVPKLRQEQMAYFGAKFSSLNKAINKIIANNLVSKSLQKSLINQVF
jgi:type I restriction enzyme, S subunit